MNEQNQDLVKIIQDNQKNQRWMTISAGLSTVVSLITTVGLIWNSKRKKTSLAMRLMKNEAAMARLALEREYLKREAKHESELNQFEAGLKKKEEKEFLTDNFFSSLKSKGEELVKQGKDQVNKFKDKFPSEGKD